MYTIMKKHTSEPIILNSGRNYGGWFQVNMYLVGMSYTNKTATFEYKLTSGNYGSQSPIIGQFVLDIKGVEIFNAEGITGVISKTGTVTVPYDDDGTLDSMRLNVVNKSTTGTYNTYSPVGSVLPLQKEPFIVNPFWNETWYDSDTQPSSYFVQDSVNQNFKLVVPYTPSGADSIKIYLDGAIGAGNYPKIWEISVTPKAGTYDCTFYLDAGNRDILYKSIAYRAERDGVQPLNYYASALYISFFTGSKYELQSGAYPFNIHVTPGKPEVSGTVIDVNAATKALTGDASVLVRHASNAKATITANGVAGAVVNKTQIRNETLVAQNVETFTFEKVGLNIFDFYAVDTRGYENTARVTSPFIEYVVPTALLKGSVVTGEGEMNLRVSGSYFQGSFGLTNNTIGVYYRYKLQDADDSEYTNWIQLTDLEINEEAKTYSATAVITGLSYEEAYIFQSYIVDKLNTVHSADYIAVSIPVFDWSADDFNFNVPVTVMGKTLGVPQPNKTLWSGSDQMGPDSNIQLSEAVSAQETGIVLVFSKADSNMFTTEFVPKAVIELQSNWTQTFFLLGGSWFSPVGAKTLVINDSSIRGYTLNDTEGTFSDISYKNQEFVLKYVIGV